MDGLEKGWGSVVYVAAILLSSEWICDIRVCLSTRLQLRMCGKKEGCVFRGAEERHSRLW